MKDDAKSKKLSRLADDLTNLGLPFSDLFQMFVDKNAQTLSLSDEAFVRFASLYDQLDRGDCDFGEKGKLLEELIAILFEDGYPEMFDVRRNQRTSSNEIDLLLNWSTSSAMLGMQLFDEKMGSSFLIECKNYEEKVGVTYLGKFFSLMCYTDTKLGIFVAWNGITGSDNSWNDAIGLVKKIALAEKKYILVLSKADLARIRRKETNIFTLLENKYQALKNDISYNSFIQKHEIELDHSWPKE
ncbi:restriction endonuclease [Lactobacillus delbrueckii]|uniref:restriction endonuclease n=1 Tax=Lactobacillus delbrueckii TaxID=1584 RepID=UPI0039917E3D